jgi:hypothetical protein
LNFEERPDYEYLYSLLETIFDEYEYEYDFRYDWVLTQENNFDEDEKDVNDELINSNKNHELNKIQTNKKLEINKNNSYNSGGDFFNKINKSPQKVRESIKNTGIFSNVKTGINNFNNNINKINCKISNEDLIKKENLINIDNNNIDVDSDKDTEEYIPKNLDYGKN